jgi:hypothetical protein
MTFTVGIPQVSEKMAQSAAADEISARNIPILRPLASHFRLGLH